MQKNVASQKWIVFAFNRTNNVPLTGDAANITANIQIDFAAAAATNDVNPTELEDGFYSFDLTQAETNGEQLVLYPASATANIQVIAVPGAIFTTPANFPDISIVASTGLLDITQGAADKVWSSAARTLTAFSSAFKTGYALSATGLDAIVQSATGMVEIAKAVWDRIISKTNHNIGQSGGKILRQSGELIQIDGSISDATPSTTNFDTNLTQIDAYFDDAILIFSNGAANAGIGKHISAYLNASGNMTFVAGMAWPVTPVNGDDFIIVGIHAHPIAEIQSGLATSAAQTTAQNDLDILTGVDGVTLATSQPNYAPNTVVPDAAGVVPTAVENRQEMDSNSTQLAAILADTASMGIVKNAAFNDFEFPMVLTSDHYTAATGVTVTGERSIDGGAFASVSGTIAEIGSGVYQCDLLAADTNGDVITYKFSAALCDDTIITVLTRA